MAAIALAGLGAGSGASALARAPHASSSGLDVLPFPGTPDAAPGTGIDFPAVSPAEVVSVVAVGSRSGVHLGRLSAQPAGQGTAFTPDRPFTAGERVAVTATLRSAAAGTASGAPGARRLAFSFSVARPVSVAAGAASDSVTAPSAGRAPAPAPKTHTFVTEPTFTPPVVTMSGHASDPGAGDVFLDAENTGQNAPYILNPEGALIWYQPSAGTGSGQSVFDVRVQSYEGRPVLTYWHGNVIRPFGGQGTDVLLDEHYRTIHTVSAGGGYQRLGLDQHEFTLGHEGGDATAFATIWSPVRADLRSVGGPSRGTVIDWIIQEIDIDTGKVIWEWHALGHVPLYDSYLQYIPGQPFDYFHLNSIQQLANGDLIISARHTWAVYSIDKRTGKLDWELGGKHSSFKMGPGASFSWQHDAALHDNGLLTLFDDGRGFWLSERQSRALEIHLGFRAHRAQLIHAYTHEPAPVRAQSMGSVQLLSDGNVFVGWGAGPYFSQYAPGGVQQFGGAFAKGVQSYRAYRSQWTGSPLQPPTIAVRPSATAGNYDVYASWNGATQVATWQVLGSASTAGPFVPVGSPRRWWSFETLLRVPKKPYLRVEALDSRGKQLPGGISAVVQGP